MSATGGMRGGGRDGDDMRLIKRWKATPKQHKILRKKQGRYMYMNFKNVG